MNYQKVQQKASEYCSEQNIQSFKTLLNQLDWDMYATLLNISAGLWGVDTSQILEKGGTAEVSRAGAMYFYLLNQVMGLSYASIGRYTNYNRDIVYNRVRDFKADLSNEYITREKLKTAYLIIGFSGNKLKE